MHRRATRRFDRVSLLVCAVAALALVVGCSSEPAHNLLGPAPQVGQVYRDETRVTITNATLTATAGGMSDTAQADIVADGVYEEEILAVADGRVTKSRTRFVTERFKVTARSRGQTETHSDTSPLEGETVLSEKVGERWKTTLVGKAPNPRQQRDLSDFEPPASSKDFYPAEPVKPGHRWTVDGGKLRKLYGSLLQVEAGSLKLTFQRTIEADGELCAQIGEELDVRGKMRDEKGEWMQMELKATGTSLRSLKRGFNLSMHLTGTMTASGTVTEGGQRLQLKISGPLTIDLKCQRK
jgi:hypothetical protein